jgi:hypothetical protein
VGNALTAARASGTVLVSDASGTGIGTYVVTNPIITTSAVTLRIHRLE